MRREVRLFAQMMERKLSKNDHKSGWHSADPYMMLSRLEEEVGELRCALLEGEGAADEAVDVANFAMMIADVVGGLKEEDDTVCPSHPIVWCPLTGAVVVYEDLTCTKVLERLR